jgi:DNA mismatch repair protein MutL
MAAMAIRKLPLLLVNQIAAGEVIERPASVVKELVENSLDAGARRVEVTVEDGGRQLIRISDDGGGIPPAELPLAIAPHATSKLQTPEQLAAISTMGFRGEALASIASVSRLRITSRVTIAGSAAESGAYLDASGDEVGQVTPDACAPGTVVEVRDLFFNTPARRKFMRAGPTEFGHIAELLGRIAMVRPDVSFTLIHNAKKTMEVLATASRRQRCIDVLGRELDEALLEFEQEDMSPAALEGRNGEAKRARVWGLAGLPAIARATGKFQYLCLNGRPIRDRTLAHAIREAYRGLVPPDKQPVAVVFLEMDPHAADVNVHPAKAEVRFHDSNRWHGLVLAAVRQRLLASDLTPKAGLERLGDLRLGGLRFGGLEEADGPSGLASSLQAFKPSSLTTSSFVDYFRRMDPQQKGFVYQEVRREVESDSEATAFAERAMPFDGDASLVAPALRAQGVLQVHQSYLVTQDEQGLLIVDQHALHERGMFEELRQRVLGSGRSLESQRLLMPAVVPAGAKRQALFEQLKPLLERIGVEAEPIGRDAVGVQAFPSFLFDRKVDPVEFCEELLDKAEDGQFDLPNIHTDEAVLHEVLDMMACKAAVKAGDAMRPEELAALLAKRDEIERSSNCPHGRPTTIRLSLKDLEKQFKRT